MKGSFLPGSIESPQRFLERTRLACPVAREQRVVPRRSRSSLAQMNLTAWPTSPQDYCPPAPGMPPGHTVLGYDEAGDCPMLVAGACSISAHRPRT